ncbi:MAG: FAD-binding oxidoreductase [Rhodospirillaceae bacterium]|jgi:glycine/D-amino acid oxidase-like deaminating enzyme|nr:FAD-binding oxidoreductase [Rhodospirillaceae bacterium]MBT6119305.1 FAD-binding oxidoreductase [Rhodospirillaceae bacterium]
MPLSGRQPVESIPVRADVVVIGGGVSGLCAALYLARGGAEVVLLEAGVVAGQGSSANAGTLALQNKRPPMLAYFIEGVEEWHRVAVGLAVDIGYGRPGGLQVAETDADLAALENQAGHLRDHGIAVDWLEGSALAARAPWLASSVRAATESGADGYADPLRAGQALAGAVEAAGGRILTHTPVMEAARRGAGYVLSVPGGTVACDSVVIATGPWSAALGRMFGAELAVEPSTIMLTATEPAPAALDRVVTHIRGRLTVKQTAAGGCLIGGGWYGRGDFTRRRRDIAYESLLHNLRLGCAVAPFLADLRPVRHWAGYEARTRHGRPLIGPVPGQGGLFALVPAAGGWTAAALGGRLIAECVLTGRVPPLAEGLGPEAG